MSPVFMDNEDNTNSSDSMSPGQSHSYTPGSNREGEDDQMGRSGTRRKEKNREAARKSRRKQTERADELHKELQCLESSNSALKKEIASLKRDVHHYTRALERHKPFCRLQGATSSSSSATQLLVSNPALTPASTSTQATAPSASTSSASGLNFQTPDCSESPCLSTTTTLASSMSLSYELFTSSRSVTAPFSEPISTLPAPHSLFCVHSESSSVDPPNSHLVAENTRVVGGPTNVSQHDSSRFGGNLADLNTLPSILLPTQQEPFQDVVLSSDHLLPLLSVPSTISVASTTSSSFDESLVLPPPTTLLPLLEDASGDLSFLELLEFNDWILQ